MAIPTISGLTPDSGLPRGGTLVSISGTNFRLQDDGDDWNEEPAQSVSVFFGSAECDSDRIWVRTTGLIECIVPDTQEDDIPATVDIIVNNIDNDGVAIAGETVTEEDGYTYEKTPLDLETEGYQTETEVIKELVLYLKRNIDASVVVAMNPDYKQTNSDPYPEEATQPAIYITGPNWIRDTIGGQMLGDEFRNLDGLENKQAEVYFFNFDIVGVTDKFRTVNNLAHIFWDAIENAPDLEITYHGHTVYVPIEGVTEPNSFDAREQKDGLDQFQASIRLVNVPGSMEALNKYYPTESNSEGIYKWES